MKRRAVVVLLLFAALLVPANADAQFGIKPGSIEITARNSDGTIDSQAGSHPFDLTVGFALNAEPGGEVEGGLARDVIVTLPPGLIGNPEAVPQCSRQQFEGVIAKCPPDTQVGLLDVTIPGLGLVPLPIYNLAPTPGVAAQLGGSATSFNALENAGVNPEKGYAVEVGAFNVPTEFSSLQETVWGVPAESAHDSQRGIEPPTSSSAALLPYLTLPASCQGAPRVTVKVDSALAPGVFVEESAPFRDAGGNPSVLTGCNAVPFSPSVTVTPTSRSAASSSGLGFELDLPNDGLLTPAAIVETEPRKTVVTLPEGMTANPSLAEGLGVCSEAQYDAEQAGTPPGAGCPEASKLGTVVAHSPLLAEAIEGSVFLAAPYENPFDSLAALYLVARAPARGVLVKQAGAVEFNPSNGRVTTTFEGLPPVPFSDFTLHFREGVRAPLVTPPGCGEFRAVASMTPFSAESEAESVTVEAPFQIDRGGNGGACPGGGPPPFHPALIAGSVNNAAGHFSPFYAHIIRGDGEQEISHFSLKLPPGVAAKLAGVPLCPNAAIAAAEAREGTRHGGQEEIDQSSCPATSQIGHILVGAGVGPALSYAPGKIYLAGPYQGSQLSIVAITAAKVGPFDLGTVVIREALRVDPETAEAFVDAAGSDPIPHIIAGIPVRLRDIRIYVDRPEFTLNPTSCEPTSTISTLLGSGLDFGSQADDTSVTASARFQAADCAALGLKPKLALTLSGKTRRAALPKLKAVLTTRARDANISSAVVTLPASEILEQGHLETVCPKSIWIQGQTPGEKCPSNSIYGHAEAVSPLLGEPLKGPVYLRTGYGTKLPELVAALDNSEINIDVVGVINSVRTRGSEVSRLRTTFKTVPDAPVSKFVLRMAGGAKGLLVNTTNICRRPYRAEASFTGHNGRTYASNPLVRMSNCPKKKGHRSHKRRSH